MKQHLLEDDRIERSRDLVSGKFLNNQPPLHYRQRKLARTRGRSPQTARISVGRFDGGEFFILDGWLAKNSAGRLDNSEK